MYKYLLCWRYLKTRYIALASVISVMLGVATMIVVNSVMAGFAEKMRDRLHGVLADVVVESVSLDGFYNSDEVMARVNEVAGDQVVAMAPTMETPGILHFRFPGGQVITQPVQIIGVRPEDRAKTGDFGEFLVDDQNRRIRPSFEVTDEIKLNSPAGHVLKELGDDPIDKEMEQAIKQQIAEQTPDEGTILGYALATYHRGKGLPDAYMAPPGTKVGLLFPSAGQFKSEGGFDTFTVVGYFKSGMSEYDSTHVYVPLERLQDQRLLRDVRRARGGQSDPDQGQAGGSARPAWPRRFKRRSTSFSPRSSASTPGSRNKGRSSARSRSSRASSISCCSSSSRWPALASWRSFR